MLLNIVFSQLRTAATLAPVKGTSGASHAQRPSSKPRPTVFALINPSLPLVAQILSHDIMGRRKKKQRKIYRDEKRQRRRHSAHSHHLQIEKQTTVCSRRTDTQLLTLVRSKTLSITCYAEREVELRLTSIRNGSPRQRAVDHSSKRSSWPCIVSFVGPLDAISAFRRQQTNFEPQ